MQTVLSLKRRHDGHSVAARIFQTAKERLLEIWDYTERAWGEEQADRHVRDLVAAINDAYDARLAWLNDLMSSISWLRFPAPPLCIMISSSAPPTALRLGD
jgi:hypothetical protein